MTTIYQEPVRADFWQLARDSDGSYIDPLGPKNCQTHTAARLIMRATEGVRPSGIKGVWPPNGYAIRRYTGDTLGGVNHSQVSSVAATYYGVSLGVRYNVPFDDVLDMVEETRGVGLSIWYRRIRDYTPRRGSFTFYQNHEIFLGGVDRDRGVFTGVIDPLADGRQTGLYHGPGEYPISLLRMAAGDLNVSSREGDYVRLGTGLAYTIMTRPTGDAPVIAPTPAPVEKDPMQIVDASVVNAILTSPTPHMRLPAGTKLYRTPGGSVAITTSREINPALVAYPGTGWRSVLVSFRATPTSPMQDWICYVPKSAGTVN
jgi:hypothetical protein